MELAMTDQLREFLVYRGLHVLCTLNKDKGLTVSHYALCLVGGVTPMWGVWTVNGRFLRFHSRKSEIERAYPNRVWRRVMAQWALDGIASQSAAKRRAWMHDYLEKRTKEAA
jgi:hypothetical protein